MLLFIIFITWWIVLNFLIVAADHKEQKEKEAKKAEQLKKWLANDPYYSRNC